MTQDVVTASPDGTILAAARRMSGRGVSCIVVVDGSRVTGILTERDILRGIGERHADFGRLRISECMSSPVVVISGDRHITEAGQVMGIRGIKRLPVMDNATLVGVVTQTDITRGLIALSPIRYVEDIMTRDVATLDAQATIDEAARIMSKRNISCLVVMHRREAAGIFTEKDLLKRIIALHKDPTQTSIVDVMSFPIVAVPPTFSILSASKKMETMHLHRLVIMDGKEVRGIVTQSDILRAIHAAFKAIETEHQEMAAQFANLVRNVVPDTRMVQRLLDQMQNLRNDVHAPVGRTTGPEADSTEIARPCIL